MISYYKDTEDFLVQRALETHENKEFLDINRFMQLIDFIQFAIKRLRT
jgi:hypothetical protein